MFLTYTRTRSDGRKHGYGKATTCIYIARNRDCNFPLELVEPTFLLDFSSYKFCVLTIIFRWCKFTI